jgi:hypothetical protein
LHKYSRAAYLLQNKIVGLAQNSNAIGYMKDYLKYWKTAVPEQVQWRLLEGLIATIAKGRHLVLVAVPSRKGVESSSKDFSVQVHEIARRLGIRFVDLQLVLRPEHYYKGNIHWNASGHRAVAAYLAALILPSH